MSPVFSNVYMMDFDTYLESKYSFCRFADNINIYCDTEEDARKAFADANHYLETKLGLKINQKKSGVYPAIMRTFLGYEFKKDKAAKAVTAIKTGKKKCEYYRTWHPSAIQKMEQDYYIISDGILNRKDFSILFEGEYHKIFISVEACSSINIYSNVIFGKSFLEYANQRKLTVNMFNKYGDFLGSFHSQEHYRRTSILLKQVTLYNDMPKRLELAVKIEIASLHNQRENLRYFYKHSKKESLKKAIEFMSDYISQMKNAKDINQLMMIEANF